LKLVQSKDIKNDNYSKYYTSKVHNTQDIKITTRLQHTIEAKVLKLINYVTVVMKTLGFRN